MRILNCAKLLNNQNTSFTAFLLSVISIVTHRGRIITDTFSLLPVELINTANYFNQIEIQFAVDTNGE